MQFKRPVSPQFFFQAISRCRSLAILLVIFALAGLGCHTSGEARRSAGQTIEATWRELGFGETHHTGFALYDPAAERWLFRYKADNTFTPASNTKILTLKAALDILPDTLIAGWYQGGGDSLVIWGGGDPGIWYPDDEKGNPLLDFIRSRTERIFISTAHFQTTRYGMGWPWDDFPYTFQVERTSMPIHGNRLWIERQDDRCRVAPAILSGLVEIRPGDKRDVGRTETGDRFWYAYDKTKARDTVSIPIAFWGHDMIRIWAQYAGKALWPSDQGLPAEAYAIRGSSRDSLLKKMMQDSDNFIAEQLLLAAALRATGIMDEHRIIDTLLHQSFAPVAKDLNWVDGSGLSRYNLATPQAMVWVLDKILRDHGFDFVREIFAAGGQSGTLANFYAGPDDKPYVFAKTGTLANQHNLSGYLLTTGGRILIFSWMNNQFPGEALPVRREMEKVISAIRSAY